ncbi:Ada metal-binding domain-containing protein [uncultured Sphingomonas sp.]|uniref:Ada metal-binding domain-containing protein n=1 Tax=uncultured Sphingomonas sp. TaxID=158754 RepID=UPI0030D70C06
MSDATSIAGLTLDEAWDAFARRDRRHDDRFVVAVRTTGIYCRPSCAARRPRRENVEILADAAAARARGYRACRRCCPDSIARDRTAVADATRLIAAAHGAPPPLAALAAAVGYAPHHFLRLFKRDTGLTPAGYARALRAARAAERLRGAASVTDAIYAAGYAAPSRFYADAARLGMAPATFADGGAGVTIHWSIVDTAPGPLLVATTPRGLCHAALDGDGGAALRDLFPAATLVAGDEAHRHWASALAERAAAERHDPALPDDARRLAFVEAVRRAAASDG